jgi:hypothetical protein
MSYVYLYDVTVYVAISAYVIVYLVILYSSSIKKLLYTLDRSRRRPLRAAVSHCTVSEYITRPTSVWDGAQGYSEETTGGTVANV